MNQKTLSEKKCIGVDESFYWGDDVKVDLLRFKEALIINASEKRRIIEVDNAIALMEVIFGEELIK